MNERLLYNTHKVTTIRHKETNRKIKTSIWDSSETNDQNPCKVSHCIIHKQWNANLKKTDNIKSWKWYGLTGR